MRPRVPQLRTEPREYLPVLPPPDGLQMDRPPDTLSKIFRVVRVECDPQRLPTGSRIFANLLGFLGRQVGACGDPVRLDDGTTAVVIGIHGEHKVDETAEIVVELEQIEDEIVKPVPARRNIFDFTEDQPH